jgi:hypothetical protein
MRLLTIRGVGTAVRALAGALCALFLCGTGIACFDLFEEDEPPKVETVDVEFVLELASTGAAGATVDLSTVRCAEFVLEEQVGGGDTHAELVQIAAGATTVSHTFVGVSPDFRHEFSVKLYQTVECNGVLAQSVGYLDKFEEENATLHFSNLGPVHTVVIGDGDDGKNQGHVLPPATIREDGTFVLIDPEQVVWQSDDVAVAVIVSMPRNSVGYVYGISPGTTSIRVDVMGVTDTAAVGCDHYTPTGNEKSLFGRWESPTSAWDRFAYEFHKDFINGQHSIVAYQWVDDPLTGEEWVEIGTYGGETETRVSFTQNESTGFITRNGVTERSFSITTNGELEVDFVKADMYFVEGR